MSIEGSPLIKGIEETPASDISFESLREVAAGDGELEELCEDAIQCAHRYFDNVLTFERVAEIQKFRMTPEDWRTRLEQLDRNRRITHNALCDKLRILARASSQAGVDSEWYQRIAGPHEDRYAVGEWALRTVFEEIYVKGDPKYE